MFEEEVTIEILPKSKEDVDRVHQQIHLKFDKLNVRSGDKIILEDVSGEVKPGEILAIMGPSGAGKSTLLNFLAGRERGMSLESGKVTINDQKATKKLRRGMGYVLQEDIFFSHLTVNQTLQFVGEIRLPDTFTRKEKRNIVNEVIDDLGLKKCINTVMGGGLFVTGCSGGEKKRCSIAVELITNPKLLMMDEPTSGLDSSTACNLIQSVKKLAVEENRAIVTTIHQPSSHVFHMFDKILLLCNGKVAYYGKTSGVIKFFEYMDMPCYANWNPADFIMEKLTAGKEVEDKIVKKFEEFRSDPNMRIYCEGNEFHNIDFQSVGTRTSVGSPKSNGLDHSPKLNGSVTSHYSIGDTSPSYNKNGHISNGHVSPNVAHEDNKIDLSKEQLVMTEHSPSKNSTNLSKWPTGFKTQSIALCKRAFIQSKSDFWDKLSFIQTFAISIIIGLLWFNTPYDEASIQDRRGVIFFTMVYLVMHPMFFALMTFPAERDAIAKERAAGMYRLSAYYTAKSLSELPILLFQPVLLYTIAYWMTGLNRSPVYLLGVFTIITISLLAQTYGLCIGACIKDFKRSITFAIITSLSLMILAGFYTKRIPYWLKWAKWISHLTYSYNILIRLEFEFASKKFTCGTPSIYDVCIGNGTKLISGEDIIPAVVTIDIGIAESFCILWSMIIAFRIIFYYALKYLNKPE